jgi:RecB family exonuclease
LLHGEAAVSRWVLSGCLVPQSLPRVDRLLSPNLRAAKRYGTRFLSLEAHALRRLEAAGLHACPDLTARRFLQETLREQGVPDPQGKASAWFGSIRELFRADADLTALAALSDARVATIAAVANAYRQRLRDHGFLDRADAFAQALELRPLAAPLTVGLVEYPYLSPLELAYLDAIAGPGSFVVMPTGDSPVFHEAQAGIDFLIGRGWQLGAAARTTPPGMTGWGGGLLRGALLPPANVLAYPDLLTEVRGTLHQVKQLLKDGVSADAIGLIVRDEATYGPTILDVAWEYGLPLRAHFAIPLASTLFGSWVRLVLTAIAADFPFEATARAIMHRLGPGLEDEPWAKARLQHPGGSEAWQSLGLPASWLDWPSHLGRHGWIARVRHLLHDSGVRSRLLPWAREMHAWNALEEGLDELASWADDVISREAAVADLLALTDGLTVPAQPGRGGINLHTPLAVYGSRYAHLFVLGLADGLLPPKLSDDPVLDYHCRRQLREQGFSLELAGEAARRNALSFWSLLQTAAGPVHLSYPATLAGMGMAPSPFLGSLPVTAAEPLAAPASPEEWRRLRLPHGDGEAAMLQALAVERDRESDAPFGPHDGMIGLAVDGTGRRFSPTQLTALGQCPFRWFADKVLHLKEVDEAMEEVPVDLRGRLYHRALELATLETLADTTATDVRAGIIARLPQAFRQAEVDEKLPVLPGWNGRREEHLRTLTKAVAAAAFIGADDRILKVEERFEGVWHGLSVVGTVDRLDQTPTGLRFVDYKTSGAFPKGVKDDDGKLTLDLQLTLYSQVEAASLLPDQPRESSVYYSLTKGEPLRPKQKSGTVDASFADMVRDRLATGAFPVDPDVDEGACTYCNFDSVCRRGPRLARKQEAR